ncbi:hypothetical protein PPYR_06382 [Photinus pyralis]|uniref:Methyltransferase type 11 domain-containing protein n=2 Tax=Photinus pyralis TaxID=7054 RepID=A0A5N4AHQ6_PHOPY|nr:ubiquinone biosynthesis O-methyltransferase, mitochondrial-like [Photinus pyralis]XP_031347263.1 ubiquinone biosynthesis O-methyltransferase, mitochondrial-like [Photinus pyralis]KAB0796829.1 hypothetical protein PPYR_10890 [Photinus pyralis]KAB0800642.1 hypothetical protein PPYR_06382 [Photinus pyralis]
MGSDAVTRATTVSEKEVLYFKQLCENWWDEDGEMLLLHKNSKLLAPYLRDCIIRNEQVTAEVAGSSTPLQNVKILEVGCGGGILSERIAEMGCELTAIDVTPELLELAKAHASTNPTTSKIRYMAESAENHAENNAQKYDVVVSSFVLEHVDDKDYFIKSCTKCLKPNGLLFLTAVSNSFWSWLINIKLFENVLGLIPKGMHDRKQCIAPQETQQLLISNNCEIIDVRGYLYNLLNRRFFWTPPSLASLLYIVQAKKNEF